METKPTVLIVSNSNTRPTSLIKLITKEHVPPNTDKICIHPWKVTTKYYSTEVDLVGFNGTVTEFQDELSRFPQGFEAVIIHMDANKGNSLQDVDEWINILADTSQPEVKLLLSNYCNASTIILKDEATLWSLNNGFEFIELFPTENVSEHQDDKEDNEPFGAEKQGIDRVIEALQNNIWSNIESAFGLNDPSADDPVDNEEFMALFSNLLSFKSTITSLPSNMRKQAAEQMVTAFWKAIGGDEEEISDL